MGRVLHRNSRGLGEGQRVHQSKATLLQTKTAANAVSRE